MSLKKSFTPLQHTSLWRGEDLRQLLHLGSKASLKNETII
jgi:hypothetical protein